MEQSEIEIGMKVSYQDMANPLKVGTLTERLESEWGVQFKVEWDDGQVSFSDLRQAGWREEARDQEDAEAEREEEREEEENDNLLLRYGDHLKNCDVRFYEDDYTVDLPCSCGWAEVRQQLDESR